MNLLRRLTTFSVYRGRVRSPPRGGQGPYRQHWPQPGGPCPGHGERGNFLRPRGAAVAQAEEPGAAGLGSRPRLLRAVFRRRRATVKATGRSTRFPKAAGSAALLARRGAAGRPALLRGPGPGAGGRPTTLPTPGRGPAASSRAPSPLWGSAACRPP